MSHFSPRAAPATLWRRFLAGVLTVVTAGLGFVAWIALTTFAVHPIMRAYSAPLAERWWDSVANILFAMVWLALVYLSGFFYQKAAARRTLWPLFAKVTLIEVLTPLLGMGIALLLIRLK